MKHIIKNSCKNILAETFSKFTEGNEAEVCMLPLYSHYTHAQVAPVRNASGLWLVYITIERDMSLFSDDFACLQVLSPESSARNPVNEYDADRVTHLSIRTNMYPRILETSSNPHLACDGVIEPQVSCWIPRKLDICTADDRALFEIAAYIVNRIGLEKQIDQQLASCAQIHGQCGMQPLAA